MKMTFHLVTVTDGDKVDIPDDALSVTIHIDSITSSLAKVGYLLEEADK